jgi:hypothetical protein
MRIGKLLLRCDDDDGLSMTKVMQNISGCAQAPSKAAYACLRGGMHNPDRGGGVSQLDLHAALWVAPNDKQGKERFGYAAQAACHGVLGGVGVEQPLAQAHRTATGGR